MGLVGPGAKRRRRLTTQRGFKTGSWLSRAVTAQECTRRRAAFKAALHGSGERVASDEEQEEEGQAAKDEQRLLLSRHAVGAQAVAAGG